MNRLIFISLILFSFQGINTFAQEKIEKESRIDLTAVPKNAQSFISDLALDNKIKWYLEQGINQTTIEAKFKHNGKKYSVEFDSIGNIEDIEVEISWKDLEAGVKESIKKQLDLNCLKHKINKIQTQYLGNAKNLSFLFKQNSNTQKLETNYELIVRCNQENEVNLFEYLFNHQGKLISTSKIIFRNSSHLEY